MLSHRANRPPGASPNEETKSACDFVALTTSHISGSRQYRANSHVTAVRVTLFLGFSTVGNRRVLGVVGIPESSDLDDVGDRDRERGHDERERGCITLLGSGERQVVRVEVGCVVG